MKKALSLYVHIPFCVKKCLYCDFLSGPATALEREEYVQLLCEEIAVWGKQLGEEYCLETIFLGGGTPSCLSPAQIEVLGDTIARTFDTSKELEYTTEANPGTVTIDHVQSWRQLGVNRISLGLQSAQDTELKRLGRIHTYEQFVDTYELLRDRGFDNINIDLMADIPGQTVSSFQDTLRKVASMRPEHLSAYSLIIEEGTPFFEMEQKGLLEREDEETDREMYEFTRRFLEQQGYHRYEISNYALRGYQCRHNCVYWQCQEYLGVGLGASSYLAGIRFRNHSTKREYKRYVRNMMRQDIVPLRFGQNDRQDSTDWKRFDFLEVTHIDRRMQMEEYCFLGLRMKKGISRADFEKHFGASLDEMYGEVLPRLFRCGLLAENQFHDRIYLTNRGIDVSNQVLAEFLLEND